MPRKKLSQEEQLSNLVDAWQAGGDGNVFAKLWPLAVDIVERSARLSLAKTGVQDPAALDEVVSVVMGHVWRLPSGHVAKYDRERRAADYLWWLAARRSQDVARRRRRRSRREQPWPAEPEMLPIPAEISRADEALAAAEASATLGEAIASLDVRSQAVIRRFMAGERQSHTAKELGICEGTVTRIRQRAILQLRTWFLAEAKNKQPRDPP